MKGYEMNQLLDLQMIAVTNRSEETDVLSLGESSTLSLLICSPPAS
ncbi:hypothetical protein KIH74_30165 [Kineosporia sp. J2-2]|uniref:SapB/AmfS family lantipeptide n=1 Tax=Kineosporia corallincola TaxID=2835133 RepID=A0ABS5TR79_9ACTN|nr:SapB/AmfS family lanthipeptide [Kineosporia corallincola]MBT0773248.1 hypothetical protein [Kineosporia corallincola]